MGIGLGTGASNAPCAWTGRPGLSLARGSSPPEPSSGTSLKRSAGSTSTPRRATRRPGIPHASRPRQTPSRGAPGKRVSRPIRGSHVSRWLRSEAFWTRVLCELTRRSTVLRAEKPRTSRMATGSQSSQWFRHPPATMLQVSRPAASSLLACTEPRSRIVNGSGGRPQKVRGVCPGVRTVCRRSR